MTHAQTLLPEKKLRGSEAFRRVLNEGKPLHNKAFSCYFRRKTYDPLSNDPAVFFSRVGYIVRKKNIPKSCQRNLVKRLIKEAFRKTLFPQPVDIIFISRANCGILPRSTINHYIQDALRQITSHT